MDIITCKNVELSYDGLTVMRKLSFDVDSGDFLCIVGENGSGKSTLIKAILGLKSVTSGTIEYHNGLKSDQIGYLPQQTIIQKDFPASVQEVVISGCLNNRKHQLFYSKDDKAKCAEAMNMLNITTLKNKSYRELSGGQQQRVLLARAICASKKLLLLDEPTNGLDPLVTIEFYSLLKKLNEKGIAIIMVSHDIKSVISFAGKVLHVKNQPLFYGTAEEYISSAVGKRFLGGEQDE